MPAETAASVIHSPEQAEPGIDRDHHDGGSLLRSLPGAHFRRLLTLYRPRAVTASNAPPGSRPHFFVR